MKITHPKFIVVIGASAGGLDALGEMVQTFEKGLDCAYCIVLHLSRKGIGDFVVHRLFYYQIFFSVSMSNVAPVSFNDITFHSP